MTVMEIWFMRMIMGYSLVRVEMGMLTKSGESRDITGMLMDMVKVIMPVPVIMNQRGMGMEMRMPF